jgi:hypothetical protein
LIDRPGGGWRLKGLACWNRLLRHPFDTRGDCDGRNQTFVRELSVAVILALAITNPDDAEFRPLRAPCSLAYGASAFAVARDRCVGFSAGPPAGQGARLDRP